MALLLVAVMGALTVAWVELVSARSGMVEQMTAATQRRIARENSRALAQEFMLERVIPSNSGVAFTYDLTGSWGGISVPAWGSAPLLSLAKSAGVNHFNPGNGDDYSLELAVTLHDGDANPSRTYKIKSRSPLLAGSTLSIQTPTLTPAATVSIGSLGVTGSAFLRIHPASSSFTADSYAIPDNVAAISVTNSAGSLLAVNNLAAPRQIANPRSGGTLFYTGQFDAIHNSLSAANSAYTKASIGIVVNGSTADVDNSDGVTCDGAGHVTIILATIPRTNIYIPGEISTLTITGQATANDAPADNLLSTLIVVDQALSSSRDLATVTFANHNNRRFDLAIKKAASASVAIQFSATSANWRMLLELENTPVALTATGIVTLRGGIRTDRSVTLSSGNVRPTPESDPKFLEQLATRTAWVESFSP